MIDLPYDMAGVLYQLVLIGAPILLVVSLLMWRWDSRASRLWRIQRVIAGVAVLLAVIPGVWLLASGNMRGVPALWILIDLGLPIAMTVPSALPRQFARTLYAAIGALVLGVFCVLGGFSIGPLYLPAATLLIVAGAVGLFSPRTQALAPAFQSHRGGV